MGRCCRPSACWVWAATPRWSAAHEHVTLGGDADAVPLTSRPMTPPPPEADVARLILAPETPGPADGGGLGHLPGVTQVDDLGEEQTTTVHYDTPDLRLTRDGA